MRPPAHYFGEPVMPMHALSNLPAPLRDGLLVIALVALGACASRDKAPDTAAVSAATTAAPMGASAMNSSDSMPGMKQDAGMKGMGGMAMTGDADRDFLRMMSDHHKGMILMAHMTKERKDGGPAVADARKLDAKQDAELDTMMTMLEKTYKDPYAAKVMPGHQAMADELKGKSGTEYERVFYQNVIKHHGEAVKMVDAYLPNAKSAAVRQMAVKIKADQTKEIAEFQKKLAAIK